MQKNSQKQGRILEGGGEDFFWLAKIYTPVPKYVVISGLEGGGHSFLSEATNTKIYLDLFWTLCASLLTPTCPGSDWWHSTGWYSTKRDLF